MTLKEEIKGKLEKFPQFRERRFRAHFLARLALRTLDLEEKQRVAPLSYENLIAFAKKYDSYRHEWDAVLNEEVNKHLRGQDYDDKTIVEQDWQLAHGYVPSFHQSVKKLSTLK